MPELTTVRFADLIDEIVACCKPMKQASPERCWDIANELLPLLQQAVSHCRQHQLDGEADQLCEYGTDLAELRHEIAMHLLAVESPHDVNELVETFGPVQAPIGNSAEDAERQSLREKELRGSIVQVGEYASKLRKSIRKTVADVDASVAVPDSANYLTVKQAAQKYQLGERTVYRLVEKGMPVTRVGKAIRINPADLELWLSEGEQGAGEFD